MLVEGAGKEQMRSRSPLPVALGPLLVQGQAAARGRLKPLGCVAAQRDCRKLPAQREGKARRRVFRRRLRTAAWHKRLYTIRHDERAIEVNRPYLRPGDEAELVVLLQMRMSRKDTDAEAVGAGFARGN